MHIVDFVYPYTGEGSGDPHFTTFDGFQHHFQGQGEFIILEIPKEVDVNPRFTLQGEMKLWCDGCCHNLCVTGHTKLAFGREDLAFEVN